MSAKDIVIVILAFALYVGWTALRDLFERVKRLESGPMALPYGWPSAWMQTGPEDNIWRVLAPTRKSIWGIASCRMTRTLYCRVPCGG